MTIEYDRAKVMANQSLLDTTLKSKFNKVVQPTYGDFTYLINGITGLSYKSSSQVSCSYGTRNSLTQYYRNTCDSVSRNNHHFNQLWNSVVYIAEVSQKNILAKYPPSILENSAQIQINKITGPEKFAVQDSLNKIMAVINSIPKILPSQSGFGLFAMRYDGTTFAMPYSKWGSSLAGHFDSKFYPTIYGKNVKTLYDNLIKLQALVNNAQSIVQAQAILLQNQKTAAAGLLNQTNALIDKVTGTPKSTYINTVNSIVQQSYEAQIPLFNDLIPQIEKTIVDQAKAAALSALQKIQAELAPLKIAITGTIPTIKDASKKTYWTDLFNKQKKLAPTQNQINLFTSTLNGVRVQVNKETFEGLVSDINKLITVLPIELGEPLYTELKVIVDQTNQGSQASQLAGIDKLVAFGPRVDKVLTEFHAAEIAATIAQDEEDRLAELAAIEAANIQEKEIKIIDLKQIANNLLPQLPTDLQTTFLNRMDEANTFDVTKKLAFYTALVAELKEALAIEIEFEDMEAVDITGLVLEIEDNLTEATDFINTTELNEDAQWVTIMPVEGGVPVVTVQDPKKTAGAGALPLALGAGYLLFNLV